ncbi:MAG: NADH-quinone oxidoreductase subunit J [Coriobacteriia bacterium]|nr:NADH-quinone oxidoreductase subunit J [Coriobacteriia bacterium]
MSGHDIALLGAALVMVAGALGAAFIREVTRLVLCLGVFLLGVAGAFIVLGSPFLAVAQIFVYVGGVLVVILFALMVVGRADGSAPRVESKHDVAAAVISLAVFAVLAFAAGGSAGAPESVAVSPAEIAESLLGPNLAVFELAGVLLLAALLSVIVIVKAGDDR